jgi:hypothetical protein
VKLPNPSTLKAGHYNSFCHREVRTHRSRIKRKEPGNQIVRWAGPKGGVCVSATLDSKLGCGSHQMLNSRPYAATYVHCAAAADGTMVSWHHHTLLIPSRRHHPLSTHTDSQNASC